VVSDITNPFFPELVKGFEEVALEHGYDVFVASTNYEPARTALCVRRMIERKVDGVAIMTSEIDPSLSDTFAKRKVPLVFLDVGQIASGVSNVKADYAHGIAQVVEHLLALGHRRFAFISGPLHLASVLERRDAFLRGLDTPPGTPIESVVEEGNHKVDGGFEAMERVLDRAPRTTAVVASNDLTAIGALRAIRQRGLRVPEDVSVAGFDDIQMAKYTEPPLTTVKLVRTEIARLACEALLHSIRTRGMGVEYGLDTSLVVRASTGRVRSR
jgi:LacI family transcriptional regulator